jgi:nucleoside-diphosphate-sugar epimerase
VNSKRILVTGATGFVGGHVCDQLLQQGNTVRALIRNPESSNSKKLRSWGVDIVIGDLFDVASVERAIAGVDVVYHLAGAYRDGKLFRTELMKTNVDGTRNMLNAALQAGVQRFVHCSTIGVHGDIQNPPATENSPYNPGDSYQESKVEGERVVLEYMNKGLPAVIFRPGGVYGPGDTRFLKLFKGIKKRTFVMLGSGEVLYQLIYIHDLIDGILLCGTKECAKGKTYILTGNEAITLNLFVRTIADELNVPRPRLHLPVTPVYLASFVCEWICKPLRINPPLFPRRMDFFRKTRSFDISKAKAELLFKPTTDLKTGVRRTVESYQKGGWL